MPNAVYVTYNMNSHRKCLIGPEADIQLRDYNTHTNGCGYGNCFNFNGIMGNFQQ